ncbi:MAG: molybdenum cofactor synthesis domain-containing protein [Lachnospiraceae bacterium]|nr:molybdenum cofactor synthesis domain-containing protein [Lachnospiraceae bacterium]
MEDIENIQEQISQTGHIVALCRSDAKGTQKYRVEEADFVNDYGMAGDAHAGHWHRQVSLLAQERVDTYRAKGMDLADGAFGENIDTEGIDLTALSVGSRLAIGEALLEVTQIGKSCHGHCPIFEATGDCIMPREGIFAVVKHGGHVKAGDEIKVFAPDPERPYTAAVITLSDRAFAGEREDKSGPLIKEILSEQKRTRNAADTEGSGGIESGTSFEKAESGEGASDATSPVEGKSEPMFDVVETLLLPDGRERLEKELIRLSDQRQVDIIFTTGGTGFSDRDQTPEATEAVCDRMTPGIPEAIRAASMAITPKAMLSRQTAGIRNHTLIINLPGSPKACREDLDIVLPALAHGLDVLRGNSGE